MLKQIYHKVVPLSVRNFLYSMKNPIKFIKRQMKQTRLMKIKKKIIKAYDGSEKFQNEIAYLKKQEGLPVFLYDFMDPKATKGAKVLFDEERALHYVLHKGKRLYYPRDYSEKRISNYYKEVCLLEQHEKSPHRYMDDEVKKWTGGVVVEVGAAEGSFSLELTDVARTIYLYECDDKWREPLEATFAPYKNVHVIKKLVSSEDKGSYCTLDTTLKDVKKDITLIKMDIEGWETEALKGAKDIIKDAKHLMILTCAYHKANAEKEITQYLGDDFLIKPRDGWMVFSLDKKLDYPYFRHGVLKCIKKE